MKGFGFGEDWMKLWAGGAQNPFEAWARSAATPPPGDPVSDLMQRSLEQWTTLAKQAWTQGSGPDAAAMAKLFDPEEWRRAGSHFDLGLEKLTEGPTYATLWDLDRKLLNLQKLAVDRARDVEGYWKVVNGAWTRAVQQFGKAVADTGGEPIRSGRQMLDLWLGVANQALLEMHRSKEFLEAQRRMTRSSTEYRLAEREIAEAFCEAHHIPTRTEMDEVQRTVTELRRELRALKKKKG